MKVFGVSYDGAELGGRAIVMAKNEREAIRIVQNDHRTTNFENVVVLDRGELTLGSVLYNWNGDPKWLEERG